MTHASLTKALMLMGAIVCGPLSAADNMAFQGTLIAPPPCKINGGEAVDVDFGNRVGIKKVNGENYRQTVDYRITCEPSTQPLDMTLLLSGNATTFDTAAVQTNQAALGIRLLQDGKPFTLNKAVAIDPKSPPVLEAVPVAEPGATLTEGVFDATATLRADYQ